MVALENINVPDAIFAGATEDERASISRRLYHAGIVKVDGLYKQVAPDIRGKINLRKAEKQDDGTYYIADVDIFYANAIKGGGHSYSADDVRDAIENTNKSISAGAQPPAVTLEHPSALAKANDVPKKAYGRCVNFRESDRGEGWARCDMLQLDGDVIKEWKAGRYTGLSAGLVCDNPEVRSNLRFGHVALLGGEAQALSELPMTEIYSACSEHAVCYSAEPVLQTPTTSTPVSPERTTKMKTNALLAAALTQFASDCDDEDMKAKASGLAEEMAGEKKKDDGDGKDDDFSAETLVSFMADDDEGEDKPYGNGQMHQDPQPVTDLPDYDLNMQGGDGPENDLDIAEAGPTEHYSASHFRAMEARLAKAEQTNRSLARQMAIAQVRDLRGQFSAEVDGLIQAGHAIDKGAALDMFSALAPDPKAFQKYRESLRRTPKVATSRTGDVFSAEDMNAGGKPASGLDPDLVALRAAIPSANFTAEDLALADAIAGKAPSGKLA